MPLVTFFIVLERPGKKRKGGLQQHPLVRRGLRLFQLSRFYNIKIPNIKKQKQKQNKIQKKKKTETKTKTKKKPFCKYSKFSKQAK